MKIIVVCVISLMGLVQAGILNDEQKAKIIEFDKECRKETNLDDDVAQKAKNGEYVDDPKLKKQFFCFNKKAGFQNESGDFQVDFIKSKLNDITKDEQITNNLINKCLVKKSTPEDTAFEAIKCFHQMSPEKDLLS
ncbi:hypothetical protein NQ317_019658 [Molorchus minor]|uniref:Uncharacterized protein n=1 Tax=Molorchus minor TaxID=1323400 RepID=A0ABQ9IZT0_9CUCU|nr:hypothetical protein NQ317_019658 [Molorchus minor]